MKVTATMESFTIAATAIIKQQAHDEGEFSKASIALAGRTMRALRIREGGALALPASVLAEAGLLRLSSFDWGTGKYDEAAKSPLLLDKLDLDVRGGTDITNAFVDVRSRKAMTVEFEDREGTVTLTGVPEAVFLRRGLDSTVLAPFFNTLASAEWKTPDTINKAASVVQTKLQAIALMQVLEAASGPPAFLTDLTTGFRAFIVIDSMLYSFQESYAWLSLEVGVALIRFFLRGGQVTVDSSPGEAGGGASSGGSGSGGSLGGGGGAGGSSGRGGGMAARPPSGGAGATPQQSGKQSGGVVDDLSPPTIVDSSPEEIEGEESDDLDAEEVAARQALACEEFASLVRCIGEEWGVA